VTLRVSLTPQADRDIDEQFAHIAEDNVDAAVRFYEAVFETFDVLAAQPHLGSVYRFRKKGLPELRRWFVRGFDSHLIFYRATDRAVIIVRVLHAARDIEAVVNSATAE
jgi:toxin ParE1/3/4